MTHYEMEVIIMKVTLSRCSYLSLLTIFLVLVSQAPLHATTIAQATFSGAPIAGQAGSEDPDYFPVADALFQEIGGKLILTLTYSGASKNVSSVNQVLTGLLWDINFSLNAEYATASDLQNRTRRQGNIEGAFTGNNVSSQWGFRDDIMNAGLSPLSPLRHSGVSTIGSINFDPDEGFESHVIGPSETQYTPAIGGVDFGIVPLDIVNFSNPPFANKGPFVQNNIEFGFEIVNYSGNPLDMEITNIQPFFGSEGAPLLDSERVPLTPEPGTLFMLGAGLAGFVGYGSLKLSRKKK
jgi:hypothetical protein